METSTKNTLIAAGAVVLVVGLVLWFMSISQDNDSDGQPEQKDGQSEEKGDAADGTSAGNGDEADSGIDGTDSGTDNDQATNDDDRDGDGNGAPKNMKLYANQYFGFSLAYPKDFYLCLNDFCQRDVKDENIQYVNITGGPNANDSAYAIQIRPLKNELGMSAIEWAHVIELQNRVEGTLMKDSGKNAQFAGQSAYQFDVKGAFKESGFDIRGDGTVMATGQGAEEFLINTEHRVVYFDRDGYVYRVTFPYRDEVFVQIINSFGFGTN